jgi:hypothetical protein
MVGVCTTSLWNSGPRPWLAAATVEKIIASENSLAGSAPSEDFGKRNNPGGVILLTDESVTFLP